MSNKQFRENLIAIEPYIPGEQIDTEGMVKLNANENPYPPSPNVSRILSSFNATLLSKYPQSNSDDLVAVLSKYYRIPKEYIMVGNGSDEVLALSFRAFFNSGRPIAFPEMTYSFYPVWANFFEIPFDRFPLDDDLSIDIGRIPKGNGGIILPNPNAPTGKALLRDEIEKLLKNNASSVVIVDEAYIDFGGESSVDLVKAYSNLIVTQTFSKGRSLAGLRVGFAFGSPELIATLYAVKDAFNSYPLDRVASAAAIASIEDEPYHEEIVAKICATRARTINELHAMGVSVEESNCNFLLIKIDNAKGYKEYLQENKVLVRYFDSLPEYLRVSIGTDEEMNEFLRVLREARDAIQ